MPIILFISVVSIIVNTTYYLQYTYYYLHYAYYSSYLHYYNIILYNCSALISWGTWYPQGGHSLGIWSGCISGSFESEGSASRWNLIEFLYLQFYQTDYTSTNYVVFFTVSLAGQSLQRNSVRHCQWPWKRLTWCHITCKCHKQGKLKRPGGIIYIIDIVLIILALLWCSRFFCSSYWISGLPFPCQVLRHCDIAYH